MKLNINSKKIEIKKALDFKSRLMGLMGKEQITEGILFPNCNAIHTFFMKDNIDVIGVNEQNQVIFILRDVPKNKIVNINAKQSKTSILELPKNTSKNLFIGSVLKFED